MVGLLQPVVDLATLLSSIGLLGALFKPIPGLLSTLEGTVNPLLSGLGLPIQLDVQSPNHTFQSANYSGYASLVSKNRGPTANLNLSLLNCQVSYESPPMVALTFPPFDADKAKVYRYRQQQMVNLAGW